MVIELSREYLFRLAIIAIPQPLPELAEQTGILTSNLNTGTNEFQVTYLRNPATGVWYVSDIVNPDGSPLSIP